MIEHIPIILQGVSVIGVPILTGMITWITNSLRKINQRIDELERSANDNRLNDKEKLNQLSGDIREMNATQQALMREMTSLSRSIERLQDFLDRTK